MSKKSMTRRGFNGLILWSAISAPALLAQGSEAAAGKIDRDISLLDIDVSARRRQEIRRALEKTERQVATLRAYKVKRDTPPALILGVFDAPQMFALEGNLDAG